MAFFCSLFSFFSGTLRAFSAFIGEFLAFYLSRPKVNIKKDYPISRYTNKLILKIKISFIMTVDFN